MNTKIFKSKIFYESSSSVGIELNLSQLNYKNNRNLSESQFINLLEATDLDKERPGSNIDNIENCSKEFIKFIYPSVYKSYSKIHFDHFPLLSSDGYQTWLVRAIDDEDVIAEPAADGYNYNDKYYFDFNYSECKFKFRETTFHIKQSARELITKEILANHPNKDLVNKFSGKIKCDLSETSNRIDELTSNETIVMFGRARFSEIKKMYPPFGDSSELIIGTCYARKDYSTEIYFDVSIDPATSKAIVSKDYKERYNGPS